MEDLMKETITKEEVCEIIKWAEYQGHIKGDIDCLIENILNTKTEQ